MDSQQSSARPLLAAENSTTNSNSKGLIDRFIRFIISFDLIFLTYTFDSCFDAEREKTKATVKEIVEDTSKSLGMDKNDRKYEWLEWMTWWYLRYFLAPSVFLVEKYKKLVLFFFSLAIVGCVSHTVYCLTQLVPEPRELNTFQRMEHSPMMGIILLACTHFICVTFAYYNLTKIRSATPKLLFPLLYCFFVGKGFMATRMVLSYSSGKMGSALDYFIWQELILTFCHAAGSFLIVPAPDNKKHDDDYATQIRQCIWRILCVDGGKTIVIGIFWLCFRPGFLSLIVDRFPDQTSQIVFALVVHFVLDMIQSFVTFFTVYLGKCGRTLMNGENTKQLPRLLSRTTSAEKKILLMP